MTTQPTETPAPDPQVTELTGQVAALTAQVETLTGQLADRDQRVRYVEQEYRTLQQANAVAANTLLASNHPLA